METHNLRKRTTLFVVNSAGLTSQHWRRLTEDAAMWRALHAKIFGGPPVPATRLKMVRSLRLRTQTQI
jgi:hypothetical protein